MTVYVLVIYIKMFGGSGVAVIDNIATKEECMQAMTKIVRNDVSYGQCIQIQKVKYE